MIMPSESAPSYALPPIGDSPSTLKQGTTPGSFALKGRIGTPWTFSSPDTPGMPPPSDKTAWDFLPADWEVEVVAAQAGAAPAEAGAADGADDSDGVVVTAGTYASSPCEACAAAVVFTDSLGVTRRVTPPPGFEPVT